MSGTLPAVGEEVRLRHSITEGGLHQRGEVVEVDPALNVAHVALNNGKEAWVLPDDLEPVPAWSGHGA